MDFDSIVVGAGVVGLAIARALALSGRSVLVLERHRFIGQETSSRNSEVIHAGIYYPQGSLKARLCVRGKEMLYSYCDSHRVAYKRVGKLIVAAGEHQSAALEAIYHKGVANGVSDLEFINKAQLVDMEPALRASKGILSPSTGIVNSHDLMLAYQGDLESAGGTVALSSPVLGARVVNGGFELNVGGDESMDISCRELINSAGLGAQTLSSSISGIPVESVPPLYLSRGCYFSLSGKSPFSRLIYPLPNNEGLGVHLTLDQAGAARPGPVGRRRACEGRPPAPRSVPRCSAESPRASFPPRYAVSRSGRQRERADRDGRTAAGDRAGDRLLAQPARAVHRAAAVAAGLPGPLLRRRDRHGRQHLAR